MEIIKVSKDGTHTKIKTITQLVQEVHDNAHKKGFWEVSDNVPEKLALIHSEVSEALEEYRKDGACMELFTEELADVCIRIFDLTGWLDLDLENAIYKKMEKNKSRPRLHGKRF